MISVFGVTHPPTHTHTPTASLYALQLKILASTAQKTLESSVSDSESAFSNMNSLVVVQSLSCVQLFFSAVDCSPARLSVHRISQTSILEWVAISFSEDLSNLGIEPTCPAWQADDDDDDDDEFTTEPPRKSHKFPYLLKFRTIDI